MVDIGHKSDLLRMDHDRLMEFEEFGVCKNGG